MTTSTLNYRSSSGFLMDSKSAVAPISAAALRINFSSSGSLAISWEKSIYFMRSTMASVVEEFTQTQYKNHSVGAWL